MGGAGDGGRRYCGESVEAVMYIFGIGGRLGGGGVREGRGK